MFIFEWIVYFCTFDNQYQVLWKRLTNPPIFLTTYNVFLKGNNCKLSFFHLIIWVRFPYVHLTVQIFILNNLFVFLFSCDFQQTFFFIFFIDFDSYYIVRTDERQPRPKYILNKCGTFSLYRGLVHRHHRILNKK